MAKPKLSRAQQQTLKSYLEAGDKTLEALAKEYRVSSKTIGKYKRLLLSDERPAPQLKRYDLQSHALEDLIQQLSGENLALRRELALQRAMTSTGVGGEKRG